MACKVKVNRHGNLAFRLYWKGREFWQGTDWKDTAKNRTKAEGKAVEITEQIKAGTFAYLKWFPNGNKADDFRPIPEPAAPAIERKTVRQYFEEWIKGKVPPLVRKSLTRKYQSHFNAHILPLHGDVGLDDYSVAELRELRIHILEAKQCGLKTAKNIISGSLAAFFRDAKSEGKILKNPFDELPRKWWPAVVTPDPDPFTEQERDEIISFFFKKYWHEWPQASAFVYLLFWSGARPSEITARRWRDFDPRTGRLSITSSLNDGEEGATKTPRSRRHIDLLGETPRYLQQIKPLRASANDHIFINRAGKPIDQKEFAWRHFWPALTALNIRHRDFYSTRDTFISVMLSHNENSKRIAEYCGTSLAMIEKSYGKWLGGSEGFGKSALSAQKPKPLPKPYRLSNQELVKKQPVGMVRGGGLEPPRHFWH